jgi:hypothetical protein
VRRAAVLLLLAAAACRREARPDPARLEPLERLHRQLQEELSGLVARDAVAQEALKHGRGELIVAIRPRFVEKVLRDVVDAYLDHVVLDLATLDAHAHGGIRRDSPFGRFKAGDWDVSVEIERLRARLHAETPALRVSGTNQVVLQLPMTVVETPGRIRIRLAWDSSALTNLICRDFELTRELDGRVLPQRHMLGGTYRIVAGEDKVEARPEAVDDVVRLKVDLTPESWQTVAEALSTQDTLWRCGLALDPQQVLDHLKSLAAEGVPVRLPRKLFQEVSLPGRFEHSARIDEHEVDVIVRARLEVTPNAYWSSASVQLRSQQASAAGAPGR